MNHTPTVKTFPPISNKKHFLKKNMNRSQSSGSLRRSITALPSGAVPSGNRSQSTNNLAQDENEEYHEELTVAEAEYDDSPKENITVVIRVRPFLPRELKGCQDRGEPLISTIRISDSRKSMVISDSPDANYSVGHSFTFDHIYGEDSRQDEIYENHARGAVLSVLKGYNVSC